MRRLPALLPCLSATQRIAASCACSLTRSPVAAPLGRSLSHPLPCHETPRCHCMRRWPAVSCSLCGSLLRDSPQVRVPRNLGHGSKPYAAMTESSMINVEKPKFCVKRLLCAKVIATRRLPSLVLGKALAAAACAFRNAGCHEPQHQNPDTFPLCSAVREPGLLHQHRAHPRQPHQARHHRTRHHHLCQPVRSTLQGFQT